MLKEFKDFAMRGNVLDVAIGIIIGAAFGKIVTSFVSDILMPPLGLLLGRVDFSNLFLTLSSQSYPSLAAAKAAGAPTINYGVFVNTLLDFLIVAFAVFLLVRQVNRLQKGGALSFGFGGVRGFAFGAHLGHQIAPLFARLGEHLFGAIGHRQVPFDGGLGHRAGHRAHAGADGGSKQGRADTHQDQGNGAFGGLTQQSHTNTSTIENVRVSSFNPLPWRPSI